MWINSLKQKQPVPPLSGQYMLTICNKFLMRTEGCAVQEIDVGCCELTKKKDWGFLLV